MGQPLWQGTYKLWQDEKFAHEFARATGAKIFHLDGILVYVSSRKGLGYICASIYNPEVKSLTGTSFFKLVEGFLRKNKIAKAVIYTNQNINPKLTGISVTPMATLVLD